MGNKDKRLPTRYNRTVVPCDIKRSKTRTIKPLDHYTHASIAQAESLTQPDDGPHIGPKHVVNSCNIRNKYSCVRL